MFDTDNEPFIYKTLEMKGQSDHSSSGHISNHPGHEISLDECHLTGLKRFTKYAITVQAFNSKGTGPSSEMIEVQTLQNDPPAPPVLKVSSVSTNSIHLSWSVPGSHSSGTTGSNPMSSNPISDSLSSSTSGQSIGDQSVDPNPITGFILHVKKPGSEVSSPVIGSSVAGQPSGHSGQSSGHSGQSSLDTVVNRCHLTGKRFDFQVIEQHTLLIDLPVDQSINTT